MNQDSPRNLREELEARLTTLLLGELPDDEAAMLRAAIERDAGLAGVYERLKHTIDLVRETAVSPMEEKGAQLTPLRLSEERLSGVSCAPFSSIGLTAVSRTKSIVCFNRS